MATVNQFSGGGGVGPQNAGLGLYQKYATGGNVDGEYTAALVDGYHPCELFLLHIAAYLTVGASSFCTAAEYGAMCCACQAI